MDLPKIQYVTHPNEDFENFTWVHRLHDGGVRWIQLRIKEEDFYQNYPDKHYRATFCNIANQLRVITNSLNMLLTINDHLDIAFFSDANGVHIGQEDLYPFNFSDRDFLIGVTANSKLELLTFPHERISYFGIGPYRKTATKSVLKSILGLEGYREILHSMNELKISQPVYAIGGVQKEDIIPLLETGVYGIAVSGLFFDQNHNVEKIREVVNQFQK